MVGQGSPCCVPYQGVAGEGVVGGNTEKEAVKTHYRMKAQGVPSTFHPWCCVPEGPPKGPHQPPSCLSTLWMMACLQNDSSSSRCAL